MKSFFIAFIAVMVVSCGEKSTYVCTIDSHNAVKYRDTVITTERGIKRYIKNHSENDNGEPSIIGLNETQVDCIKL